MTNESPTEYVDWNFVFSPVTVVPVSVVVTVPAAATLPAIPGIVSLYDPEDAWRSVIELIPLCASAVEKPNWTYSLLGTIA